PRRSPGPRRLRHGFGDGWDICQGRVACTIQRRTPCSRAWEHVETSPTSASLCAEPPVFQPDSPPSTPLALLPWISTLSSKRSMGINGGYTTQLVWHLAHLWSESPLGET